MSTNGTPEPQPPRQPITAASIGAAVGVAAKAAADSSAEAGTMGLKGIFGLVGQSTAMVCLTVMMFATYYVSTSATRSQINFLQQMVLANADKADRQAIEAIKNREAYTEQHSNIFNAIHQLEAKADKINEKLDLMVRILQKMNPAPEGN